MYEEIRALHYSGTCTLVPFHSSMNVVDSRWVYKIKKQVDGSVGRYKTWLVTRGFTQHDGIDYLETFSFMIKHTTI